MDQPCDLEKHRSRSYDIGFGNRFLDMTSKHEQQEKKLDKLDLTKIKTFVHQRTLLRK